MIKDNDILILEDDTDDQEILESIFDSLGMTNKRQYFQSSSEFLAFLVNLTKQPFLIISDINVPKQTGLEIKRKIQESDFLRSKTIPYIFLTTSASPGDVKEAFDLQTQGFFVKPDSVGQFAEMIRTICFYWKDSLHPNNI